NTTAQVVIVTLDSINGSDMNQYATQLGNNWGVGIGTAKKDNGLLMLYVADQPINNRFYVATGYGTEGVLPASMIGRLLDENYVPLKNKGNISEGIIAFSNAIYPILIQNADYIRADSNSTNSISLVGIIIFLLVVFLIIALIAYPFVSRKRKGFGDFMMFFFIDFLVRIIIYSIIFRGGSGRSSGGGFRGGGFGGGGFGGGGAGR
ncbi:MAG: TPM domain-containing protein, partial [archaeon]